MNLLNFITSLESAKISPEQIIMALKEHLILAKEENRQRVKKHREINDPVTKESRCNAQNVTDAIINEIRNEINDPVTKDALHSENATILTKEVSKKEVSKKEKKEVSKDRGSRFALTELPVEWETFCFEKRPDLNPHETFDAFRDWWVAAPGGKGLKADWTATWRNWVRNQKREGINANRQPTKQDRFKAAYEQAGRDIDAMFAGQDSSQ